MLVMKVVSFVIIHDGLTHFLYIYTAFDFFVVVLPLGYSHRGGITKPDKTHMVFGWCI